MSALTVYGHKTVCTVANLGFQNCKVAYEMFSGPASHSAISERLDLSLSDTLDAIEAGRICKTIYKRVICNPEHGMTMIDFNDVLKAHCALMAFQS